MYTEPLTPSMPRKKQVQTRIATDTNEQLEQYQEDRDISQADAVRRLIQTGLAKEGYPVTATDGGTKGLLEHIGSPTTILLGTISLMLGTILLSGGSWLATSGDPGLALAALTLSTVTMLTGIAHMTAAVLAQLTLARPLKGLLGINTEADA